MEEEARPREAETTQLFVAARRNEFAAIARELPRWPENHSGANQLFELENRGRCLRKIACCRS